MIVTRFAPSPTGPLHLGHAYSAIVAHDLARADGGRFLLRLDDLDQTRTRPEWEALIEEDLTWLGLSWDGPIARQTDMVSQYREAIDRLAAQGLVYPCRCKRRDILAAGQAMHEGEPPAGPDGLIYPGTCRHRTLSEAAPSDALRLNLAALTEPRTIAYHETGPLYPGCHSQTLDDLSRTVGDPVLARPNLAASYNFAVSLDDAASGVTDVVRGVDIWPATALQRLFQILLDSPPPRYHHHRLVRDEAGKRLAKRDNARAISRYRADGMTPEGVRALIGL